MHGNNYPRLKAPSPLRSGFKVDPNTGEIQSEDGSDDDNDDDPDVLAGHQENPPALAGGNVGMV